MDKQKIKEAAEAAHEVNRAYCLALGDRSQPSWDEAPEWQRHSAISGVTFIAEYPQESPRESHENWLAQKKAEGWVFGEVKDPYKKTHPCMVNYNSLPVEQRAKDHLFGIVVRAVLGLPLPGWFFK